ncbi:MAG: hypothetical protein JWP87_1973, partial [Labilithrix sp.]|nr:hypothetical protein [Labilithrix sp.]
IVQTQAPARIAAPARLANVGGRARAAVEAATPKAPSAAAVVQAADPSPKLDDAARTATMLREQLANTLH